VLVLYFGFTSCPDACPTALARMVSVRRALGMNAVGLQVALVTLDPERDTRERLAAYVAAFDPGFLGLRPEPGTVDAIAAPFRVYHHRTATGDGYTIDHSGLLYVVDCSGRKRLAFRPEETPAQMAAALRPLLAEAGCQLLPTGRR